MIVFQSPVQLLLLGAFLVSPGSLQPNPCKVVQNPAKYGTYRLSVKPHYYKPGVSYTITVSGIENATSIIFQAMPSKGSIWESENQIITCYDNENLVQKNISNYSAETRWTSPSNTNQTSVKIRAFVTFANGTTLLQTQDRLKEEATAIVTPSPATTNSHEPKLHSHSNHTHVLHNVGSSHQSTKDPNNSVSIAHASHFLLTALQLFSISLGYKLLS